MGEAQQNGKPLTPTSIESIKAASSAVVELPGWTEEQPFIARVQRVTLLSLVYNGQVPNELVGIAHKFATAQKGQDPIKNMQQDDLPKFVALLHAVAKASLAEPSYDQLQEAGIELTDNQLSALFLYSQRGVSGLESFRARVESAGANGVDRQDVRKGAK